MLNTEEKISKYLTETITLVSSVNIIGSLRYLFLRNVFMQIIKIKVLELSLTKVHVLFFPSLTEKVWATIDDFISTVSEPICSCSLKATKCNDLHGQNV